MSFRCRKDRRPKVSAGRHRAGRELCFERRAMVLKNTERLNQRKGAAVAHMMQYINEYQKGSSGTQFLVIHVAFQLLCTSGKGKSYSV